MHKVFEYAAIAIVAVCLLWLYPMWILSSFQSALRQDCEAMGQSRKGDYTVRCEVVKKEGA